MDTVIDLINNIISFNKKTITYVIDVDEIIWFRYKDVTKFLQIKDTKSAIRMIDDIDRKSFGDLQLYYKKIQHKQTVYITESGLYSLLLKTKVEKAKEFQRWLIREVLPQLRTQGVYELNKKLKDDIIELEKKINQLQKELDKFQSNKNRDRYIHGGHIYVIDLLENESGEKIYKIGQTNNLEKRLQVYNVGRASPIDYIKIYKTENALCIEGCVRALLKKYQFAKSRDKFLCNFDLIDQVIINCIKTNVQCNKTCSKSNASYVEINPLSIQIHNLNSKLLALKSCRL